METATVMISHRRLIDNYYKGCARAQSSDFIEFDNKIEVKTMWRFGEKSRIVTSRFAPAKKFPAAVCLNCPIRG
ncbi:MAG: hypothetical protein ACR2GD_07830 [Pyrinomonadaceae bacterium]